MKIHCDVSVWDISEDIQIYTIKVQNGASIDCFLKYLVSVTAHGPLEPRLSDHQMSADHLITNWYFYHLIFYHLKFLPPYIFTTLHFYHLIFLPPHILPPHFFTTRYRQIIWLPTDFFTTSYFTTLYFYHLTILPPDIFTTSYFTTSYFYHLILIFAAFLLDFTALLVHDYTYDLPTTLYWKYHLIINFTCFLHILFFMIFISCMFSDPKPKVMQSFTAIIFFYVNYKKGTNLSELTWQGHFSDPLPSLLSWAIDSWGLPPLK